MSFPVYCFITPVLLNNENLMDISVTDVQFETLLRRRKLLIY